MVTLVFSITIVTLTLASTQFGPRMLRNFIRDRITQITLGSFVATFVYSILALVSIGPGAHGEFVPHLSITVTMALVILDVAVLVLFIDHIAKSIQLPQVIASIARDLSRAIEADVAPPATDAPKAGPSLSEMLVRLDEDSGVVRAPSSGYLQYVSMSTLIDISNSSHAVIRLLRRPGHFVVEGEPLANVWPAAQRPGLPGARRRPRDGPAPDANPGSLLRGRPAGRDRHPRPLAGGQRHLHGARLHRLAR